jgi:alanine racemase
MIDLSDIPEASSGDEVVVFGAGHPIERLAQAGMTIPYEILTDISPRVKRVYLKE